MDSSDSTNSIVLKIDTIINKTPNLDKSVKIEQLNKTNKKPRNLKRKIESTYFSYDDYKSFYKENSKKKPFLYKQQIIASLIKLKIPYSKNDKKNVLLDKMINAFKLIETRDNTSDIKKINLVVQKWRHIVEERKYRIYGPGFKNKKLCKNNEDCFTLESINDIDDKYFFSTRDKYGSIFFFDIRTFNKLIVKKSNNPFTREPFSDSTMKIFEDRKEYMTKNNIDILFKEDLDYLKNMTPEEKIDSRLLNLFQIIDELNVVAGGTRLQWFNNLTMSQLKNYYKVLEDIWNYRANLSTQQKQDICPNRHMFSISVNAVFNINNIIKIKNIVLNEIEALITTSEDVNHRHTGAYYTLIAFTEVSGECANDLPWLIQY